jgi:hypothetical protein
MKFSEIISLIVVVAFLFLVGLGAWFFCRLGGWLAGLGGGIVLFFTLGTMMHKVFDLLNRRSKSLKENKGEGVAH